MPLNDSNLLELGSGGGSRVCAIPREVCNGSVTLTSGKVQLVGFTPSRALSVTSLITAVRSTAAATITLARLGLYTVAGDGAATLVARGPASTSLGGATFTTIGQTLDSTGGYPSVYSLLASQRYALACIWVATTQPVLYGSPGAATPNGWLPWLGASVTGQTDLATSYTAAQMTAGEGNLPLLACA